MNTVRRILGFTSQPVSLATLIVLLLAFRHFMQALLGQLEDATGASLPDYRFSYSEQELASIFALYGEQGFDLYFAFMRYDLVFPALYSVLFASLIHILVRKLPMYWLAIVPLGIGLFDYIENAFLFTLASAYPDLSSPLVLAANACTMLKWSFGAASAVAGLSGLILWWRARNPAAID